MTRLPLSLPLPSSSAAAVPHHLIKKIVVVMGPTGCGKSKLSVDLASRYFPASEIINSDKIQAYRGLEITTNKIPFPERKNVPHYLLGHFAPSRAHPVFTPSDFRSAASLAISRILFRRKLPFIVGGSNSFLYALLAKKFNPAVDVFDSDSAFCRCLRYKCCFIWIDAAPPVLNRYLDKRVDDMLDSGMLEELSRYFAGPDSSSDSVIQCGLKMAIGVPEFERFFQNFPQWPEPKYSADVARKAAYDEAVRAIKDNTCQLAKRQVGKILRLRNAAGWDLKRVDATESIAAAMGGGGRRQAADIWEEQVVQPSVNIVTRFLMEE